MPTAPAVVGNLYEKALGRPAHILGVTEPAPGFVEIDMRAAPPSGGWQPGHELQFRPTSTTSRRYSVRTVEDTDRVRVLAHTETPGPGAAWIRRLQAGDETVTTTARHWPLRKRGTRRLYLGDGCALGTIDALAEEHAIVAVEAPAEALPALTALWPRYHFVPEQNGPGDALQAWLENTDLTGIDGALLLGHAQSIQRQRAALVGSRVLPRAAITTKPYWSTGKAGL